MNCLICENKRTLEELAVEPLELSEKANICDEHLKDLVDYLLRKKKKRWLNEKRYKQHKVS